MSVGTLQFMPNNSQILHSSIHARAMDSKSAIFHPYIRFRFAQQQNGDSLRQLLEASERYVAEHGLVLDRIPGLPILASRLLVRRTLSEE